MAERELVTFDAINSRFSIDVTGMTDEQVDHFSAHVRGLIEGARTGIITHAELLELRDKETVLEQMHHLLVERGLLR